MLSSHLLVGLFSGLFRTRILHKRLRSPMRATFLFPSQLIPVFFRLFMPKSINYEDRQGAGSSSTVSLQIFSSAVRSHVMVIWRLKRALMITSVEVKFVAQYLATI
jgi:hypothetical protein